MNVIYRSFSGLSLSFRPDDNYVNATALAKRYYEKTGKRRDVTSWLILKRTKETLSYISELKGVSQESLYEVIQGGSIPDEQGTFIHPDLVIPFATWLSVEFEYLVTQIVLQRMSDKSRKQNEEALNELINTLQIYFREAEGFGESVHTASHRQMERIRSGLNIVQSRLDEMRGEN